MTIKNATISLSLVATPAPFTAPTFPAGADILCPTQKITVSTEVETRETAQGCGGNIVSIVKSSGKINIEKLTLGTGWNFAQVGGGTPEGMAIRIALKVNAAAATATNYEGIIKTWEGDISTTADTAERVEIVLVKTWTTDFGG